MTKTILRVFFLTAWLEAAAAAAGAQQAPATPDQLAAITQRGRNLYAYDQAAWHGTDAVQKLLGSDSGGLQAYIARKTASGWEVDFGALDAAGTSFLIRAQAHSTDGRHFTAQAFAPPHGESGFLVGAARAVATAKEAFVPIEGYAYNVAVLPNGDGTLYVYLYPAQAKLNVYPVGGDTRYTISADGTTILETHRMHKNVLFARTASPIGPNGGRLVANVFKEVLSDVPQDTDVFHVLAREPHLPSVVVARGQRYFIDVDGAISYKGPAEPNASP
ncbi:MAG TPA: hypothetical protein VHS56_03575 [Candidatus Cybelea sp.]|nr:hypothetical protein [Candidatus Cybelea sp.]